MTMKLTKKDISYVLIQLLLFITYLFRISSIDFHARLITQYAGLALAITGAGLILISFINLNNNLTPFPSPKSNSTLITTGVYKYIRHPIYTGILLSAAGYAVYSENTLRLIVCAALLILFLSKAAYEETLLIKKFSDYHDYKLRTAALLPGVY